MVTIRYLAITICFVTINLIHGQDNEAKKSMEICGFVMTDVGYKFNQQQDWCSLVRSTSLNTTSQNFSKEKTNS
ncbi:hypothetical protein [Flavobacterium mesophilum]|uniref:hypothetical protein n=1 Tax=Flavobacterium mesophilum TaxID=3143495 RepID=UPI0031DE7257